MRWIILYLPQKEEQMSYQTWELLSPQVNQMKSDLTVDELLGLCKEILIYNNYTVIDPNT